MDIHRIFIFVILSYVATKKHKELESKHTKLTKECAENNAAHKSAMDKYREWEDRHNALHIEHKSLSEKHTEVAACESLSTLKP